MDATKFRFAVARYFMRACERERNSAWVLACRSDPQASAVEASAMWYACVASLWFCRAYGIKVTL